MFEKKWFKILVTAILVFALIYLISITNFVFAPVAAYLTAIALPIIGAGIIFYVTNPIVDLLERYKVHRVLGIIIVFILIIALGVLFTLFIAPIVEQQFNKLMDNIPDMIDSAEKLILLWQHNQEFIPAEVETTIQNITGNLDT